MLKLGIVSYVNSLPLSLPIRLGSVATKGIEVTFDVPSALNAALLEGQLDASLISTSAYLSHRDHYQRLEGYGIAACGAVTSVNLYTRIPLWQLDGREVGVTAESATSTQLLRLLCEHYWNVSPIFKEIDPADAPGDNEAVLLIGDSALKNLQIPGYSTIDLSEVWYHATGLPFAFAVLAANKGIDISPIFRLFDDALSWSYKNMDIIYREAQRCCPLPTELYPNYYRQLHFQLTEGDERSISQFTQLLNTFSSPITV